MRELIFKMSVCPLTLTAGLKWQAEWAPENPQQLVEH